MEALYGHILNDKSPNFVEPRLKQFADNRKKVSRLGQRRFIIGVSGSRDPSGSRELGVLHRRWIRLLIPKIEVYRRSKAVESGGVQPEPERGRSII